MRFSIIFLLLLPSLCSAVAPEAFRYVGVNKQGKRITLLYKETPTDFPGGGYVWGSNGPGRMRFCAPRKDSAMPGYPDDVLACAPDPTSAPSLIYRSAGYDPREKTGIRYKEAMQVWKAWKLRSHEDLNNYYICVKGCDSTVPLFLFEIGEGY